MVIIRQFLQSSRLIRSSDKALEIPTVTEVKGDDGLVSVRPAANDAYKVCVVEMVCSSY